MTFIETIKEKAKKNIKNIVLPEGSDIRTLQAASIALKEEYANVTILGDSAKINQMAQENNLDITKATIINPVKSEKYEEFCKVQIIQHSLRKKR